MSRSSCSLRRGFDAVSVDDVAQAAGIARRTLFRYYASKNAIPWGDFDAHLEHLRELLDEVDPERAARRSAALGAVGVQHLRRVGEPYGTGSGCG